MTKNRINGDKTMSSHSYHIRLSGALQRFVEQQTGENGLYETPSEYFRDLVRRDMGFTPAEHREIAEMLTQSIERGEFREAGPEFFDEARKRIRDNAAKRKSRRNET
jgi:antitoxin ParD1/3/4